MKYFIIFLCMVCLSTTAKAKDFTLNVKMSCGSCAKAIQTAIDSDETIKYDDIAFNTDDNLITITIPDDATAKRIAKLRKKIIAAIHDKTKYTVILEESL